MKKVIKGFLAANGVCLACILGGGLLTDWLQFHKTAWIQFLWPLPLFYAGMVYQAYLSRRK